MFQLVSDIHLEFYPNRTITPTAPYLILAGDIGNINMDLISFLNYCSQNWEHTFYVTGNHEYYNTNLSIEEVDEYLSNLNIPRVHFLQNSTYQLNDVIIAGCTLWSSLPKKNSKLNQLHDDSVEWIWHEILLLKLPVIMITHFSPLSDVPGFCTDLKYLMEDYSPIKKWCYGHTHQFYNDKKAMSNPIGYENEYTGYKENFTFKL